MEKNFACIEYMKSIEEIPLKYNILKICPAKVMDWYVKKFNPFKIEDIEIANISGYKIKMPFTEIDIKNDISKVNLITSKTLAILESYNIEIITFPKNYEIFLENNIREATGKYLMSFFLIESMVKALKIVGKKIKNAEVLIIDGDSELTKIIIDNIYLDVNYLSVLVSEDSEEDFESKIVEVFDDSGLNIQISKNAKSQLKSADIIINTSHNKDKYDFHYKRGAIYFDLSNSTLKYDELVYRRPDILAVNNFRVSYNDEYLSLDYLELAFFIKCSYYKSLIVRGYKNEIYKDIKEEILKMNLKLCSFYSSKKLLNSSDYTRIISKAGIK